MPNPESPKNINETDDIPDYYIFEYDNPHTKTHLFYVTYRPLNLAVKVCDNLDAADRELKRLMKEAQENAA